MYSILFLGYSNLIKSRILPIINRTDFNKVEIAKYYGQMWDKDIDDYPFVVKTYDNYEEGIMNFNGNVVYVSTVNSSHYKYAKEALLKGFHVIIDKPATLTVTEAEDLIIIAKKKCLLVCESTVYLFHPQIKLIESIFSQNNDNVKLLTVHFSLPPFLPDNFRYKKELGGGALMDTLPYAVSISRYFFKTLPLNTFCVVSERDKNGLDIEYSLLSEYPEGKTMIGHFGFNTEYINQLIILGTRTNISLNRIFTIPENFENPLLINHMNNNEIIKSPCGNSFEIFFNNVISDIKSGHYDESYNALIYDAKAKDIIINKLK